MTGLLLSFMVNLPGGMMLSPNEPRCADALDQGCPERKVCQRWVYRLRNPHWPTTPWKKFAIERGPAGCSQIIKLESGDALENDR